MQLFLPPFTLCLLTVLAAGALVRVQARAQMLAGGVTRRTQLLAGVILGSGLWGAQIVTLRAQDLTAARDIAWKSFCGFQSESKMMTVSAVARLMPGEERRGGRRGGRGERGCARARPAAAPGRVRLSDARAPPGSRSAHRAPASSS